jgi:hypothetical protein
MYRWSSFSGDIDLGPFRVVERISLSKGLNGSNVAAKSAGKRVSKTTE